MTDGAVADADRARVPDPGPLLPAVDRALERDGSGLDTVLDLLEAGDATAERDELRSLLSIHELWLGPPESARGREQLQLDPRAVAVKRRLEQRLLDRLDRRCTDLVEPSADDGAATVAAIRRIATKDLVPPVYRWVADGADATELVRFLALEGGPDAGFDDLVALAQVGLRGVPKVALALNYWDEMGCGSPEAVHTTLHDRMVSALGMTRPDPATVPMGSLERSALGGTLATDRSRQPECLGALGLLELQAGPRCRAVLTALDRLDGPAEARAFYEEHAVADPRHGRDWLERVVRPLAGSQTGWGPRMIRGARWRSEANRRLFDELAADAARSRPVTVGGR